jgi:hypothetical protein
MLSIILANRRHCRLLSPFLRAADAAEIAAHGHTPLESLALGLRTSSPCYTVLSDRWPCAMFGVVPHGNVGIVWMLGSELLIARPSEFARCSLEFADRLFRPFDVVANLVDLRNTVHIRWLEWLGCTFHKSETTIIGGHPFGRFSCANLPRSRW